MNTYTRDVLAAQAALLASDITLGQALRSLVRNANRTELFAAVRERDRAEVGRIFLGLLDNELRFEAVRLVSEATREEMDAQMVALHRDFDRMFADCPRPLAPCSLSGDGS